MSISETRAVSPAHSAVVAAPTSVSAQALAGREAVRMQAAMLLAITYPRDEQVALDKLLKACTRSELAEEAIYEYARGGSKISGPSIRLAEEMQRCWGHIVCGVEETRGATSSEWRAWAWDLESLSGDEKLFTVKHWRDTRGGGYAVTDERDIYEIGANMAARRKRACILSCIPQYVQDAAEAQCRKTLEAQVDITPERVNSMLEAFKAYNVTSEMIERKIQSKLEAITPGAMVKLRNIYNALRDGVAKPTDFFEVSTPAADADKSQTDRVKEALRGRGAEAGDAKKGRKTASPSPGQADLMPGEAVPYYTQANAIAALKACANTDALKALWTEVTRDYRETNRALPLEIEAFFNERLEVLGATEGD